MRKYLLNKISISQLFLLIIAILFMIFSEASFATSAYSLNEKGNEAFKQKKYDEALKYYIDAQVKDPNSPELNFNIGNVYIKQKKYDDALQKFQKAANESKDKELAAVANYNAGVCQFRQAEQIESTGKLQDALKKLEECMETFRQALRKNPNDQDAKYNHEQAKKKWKEILQKIKDQQQKQQQDQKQEQQQQEQQDGQQQQQQQQAQAGEQDKKKGEEKKEDQKGDKDKEQQEKDEQEKQMAAAKQDEDKKDEQQTGQQNAEEKKGELSEEDVARILSQLPDENKENYQKMMRHNMNQDYKKDRDW